MIKVITVKNINDKKISILKNLSDSQTKDNNNNSDTKNTNNNSHNSTINDNGIDNDRNSTRKVEKNNGFLYRLKKHYQEKRNNFKKTLLVRNDNNTTLKSNMLTNSRRINRSKTNLMKKNENNFKSLKEYEAYDNPDENKIKYIKKVYKKKYKKLISNEIKEKSDSIILNNYNKENTNENKNIFYLEFYNTKNKIIDLNKNENNEISSSQIDFSTDTDEIITIEFVKKKYNIIDLNQRINNSNLEIKNGK